MRIFSVAAACAAFGFTAASAADEVKCADQYSLEEHQILEWAALGGDPHAQFAMSTCAAPRANVELTRDEKVYALKWLMLAACEADGVEDADKRDRALRRLKYDGDISFRRFGGITRDETWTPREKKLIEFRQTEIADIESRLSQMMAQTTFDEQARARDQLADQFSRMGALGLTRLASLSSCSEFGADRAFEAAAWSAAAQAWNTSGEKHVYGLSQKRKWTVAGEAEAKLAALSTSERRIADTRKDAFLRTDPMTLARLEDKAALADLDRLSFMHAQSGNVSFSGRSVTLALQYALESLGWIDFVNGPDNDYGPSTIEAARKMQAAQGVDETRWLSHEEIRKTVCDAATIKGDPVSYFHLSLMFSEGWGFARDLDRAAFAAERADSLLDAKLAKSGELPAWKRDAYRAFEPRIDSARELISAELAATPAHLASNGPSRINEVTLCE